MILKRYILFSVYVLSAYFSSGQNVRFSPSVEFRGVWIATLQNIDYPQHPTTNVAQLKKEWMEIINDCKDWNMNAVIVQVRAAGDAIYPSKYSPYCKWTTGSQDAKPDQYFDLLAYMINTAHVNGLAFHAWVNPFREVIDGDTVHLSAKSAFRKNRSWFFKYGREWLYNPGVPMARKHFINVVEELVRNYTIDAVHFDDYFYPYKIAGEQLNDSAEYALYGKGFLSVEDWRRHNVDLLMSETHRVVKSIRPEVQIGVSPFGVWRNQADDPDGSDTRAGQTSYDALYADVLKWSSEGWLDYIAPQLYWHIGFPTADYKKLVYWWVSHIQKTTLYIGHAVHKVNNNKYPEWSEPDQLIRQIAIDRSLPQIKGSMFFSYKDLKKNPLGVTQALISTYYSAPANIGTVPSASVKPLKAASAIWQK